MSTDPDEVGTRQAPAGERSAALQEEIEHTREDLGATVGAIADKADVKAQVSSKVEEAKAQMGSKAQEAKAQIRDLREHIPGRAGEQPGAAAAAGVGLIAVVVAMWLLRRRRHP